jgi:hypothetical protein
LSPAGGGVLTLYGRELSREILSTWGEKGEQYFSYGKIPTDEKVLLGAFVRVLQMREENEKRVEARTILMQADAEAGYNSEKWAVDATIGRQEIRKNLDSEGRVFSRRYYLLYRPTDKVNVRAGKFLQFYGLNDPNHNLYVRRELNFGFDTETPNLEVSYLGDNWSSYLTYVDGASNKDEQYSYLKDRALSFTTSYFFQEKNKIGASFYRGEDDDTKRSTAGPWLLYSFTPQVFLMSEFDYQIRTPKAGGDDIKGYVTSNRLNYEVKQGLIPFALYEKTYLNKDDPTTERQSYGAGIQFFPRPHFELVGVAQHEENPNNDLVWALVHFYL